MGFRIYYSEFRWPGGSAGPGQGTVICFPGFCQRGFCLFHNHDSGNEHHCGCTGILFRWGLSPGGIPVLGHCLEGLVRDSVARR